MMCYVLNSIINIQNKTQKSNSVTSLVIFFLEFSHFDLLL